jgi:hypothetical protein
MRFLAPWRRLLRSMSIHDAGVAGLDAHFALHAFAAAATAGYSSITLWASRFQRPAISFYTAVGFVQDGATKTERISSDDIVEELRLATRHPTSKGLGRLRRV